MTLNIKIKGKPAKTYDCTYFTFKFDRLMMFNGDNGPNTFSIAEVEWFTVDNFVR